MLVQWCHVILLQPAAEQAGPAAAAVNRSTPGEAAQEAPGAAVEALHQGFLEDQGLSFSLLE